MAFTSCGRVPKSVTLLHPVSSTFVGNYAKVINCGVSALPDSPGAARRGGGGRSDLESLLTSHIESGGGGGEGRNEERERGIRGRDGRGRTGDGGRRKEESVSRSNNNANPAKRIIDDDEVKMSI